MGTPTPTLDMGMDFTADYWDRQRFGRDERDVAVVVRDLVGLYGMAPTCYLASAARVAAAAVRGRSAAGFQKRGRPRRGDEKRPM